MTTNRAVSFDDLEGATDDVLSFEDLKNELVHVESEIGRVHHVRGRRLIINYVGSGMLEEDELVAKWVGLYTAFKHWCHQQDPPRAVEEFRQTAEGRHERPFCFSGLRCRPR